MDHAEVRDLLDLAAVEPGGLDRLIAGDTPAAIAAAGHLAGCPGCMEEFGRLRRESAILREIIATQLPPELRARTLAFVAAVGRPREVVATTPGMPAGGALPTARPGVVPAAPAGALLGTLAAALPGPRRAGRSRRAWLAAVAAIVVATSGVTGVLVSSLKDGAARQASLQLEGLAEVATWTLRLDTQPDVRRITLAATPADGGSTEVGTLTFSPGLSQMVVVAKGLTVPPAGQEYRCWVEIAGARQRLGRMYLSGDLAYWVGDAPALAAVPSGSVFGVSLAETGNPAGAGPAVLSGALRST